MNLSDLKNTQFKKTKRIGRGPGSNKGKTSCRGHKGDKSRSGYKRRAGKEGGQLPLFQKVPGRGFTNAKFKTSIYEINLERIEYYFEDGEIVNKKTLIEKGFPLRRMKEGFKVLSKGDITKKIVIEANKFSKNTIKKLEEKGIEFRRI